MKEFYDNLWYTLCTGILALGVYVLILWKNKKL